MSNEEEYRLIFENAPLGLLSFNDQGIIQTCNTRFIDIIGSSKEKLIGLCMLTLPDKKLVQAVKAALDGDTGFYEGLYRAVTSEKVIPVRGLFTAKLTNDKRFAGGVGIIEDISEQYYTAQALRDSEEKFRLVFSHSTDGLLITDTEGRVTDWNHTYENLTGISETEASGQYLWDLQFECMVPEKKSAEVLHSLRQTIQNALISGEGAFLNQPKETIMVSRSGRRIAVENVGFLIPSSKGYLFGGRVTDITARKAAEAKIKALLEEKSLILKEVHHRIKNNMAMIVSLLTLQADAIQDPVDRDALSSAAGRVQSMMLLYEQLYTGDLVGFAKANEYIPALVQDILDNTREVKRITPNFSIANVEMNFKTLQYLGILINELVTNAIKYAFRERNDGSITIDLHRDGDFYVLVVADNGCGLPLASVKTGKSSQKEQAPHDGFGMTLVRLLVEQLQGNVHITSHQGTTVTLRFKE
ncbi:PAS domain S-box protein [Gracilinema caldarium]|uniref:Signal transduction histidine kinase n=1 Tax=Gracilinema caldarium (strain ATCC 51460 / DSM 7334 / H1) TaxID=744872 RepID=F8EYY2_GRAC1|nr:PAS domain S-box protein [Gracilinema caldarium]AEJ18928.1 signal transduction histidine kinase [Gracilinema caldarium DSM 7334]